VRRLVHTRLDAHAPAEPELDLVFTSLRLAELPGSAKVKAALSPFLGASARCHVHDKIRAQRVHCSREVRPVAAVRTRLIGPATVAHPGPGVDWNVADSFACRVISRRA